MKKQIMAAITGLMALTMTGCALTAQAKTIEPAVSAGMEILDRDETAPNAGFGTGEKEMTVTAAGQGMITAARIRG